MKYTMKKIKVVIGKNFGDEGKGQMTALFCRGEKALVVRNNGGAQAGHTVEKGNFRFVFHQLGSGSLYGCPTYWGKEFLPDLLKLEEEIEELTGELQKIPEVNGWFGRIFAHPECRCTTVLDVLVNSLTETLRGAEKHGSCGMGIYETVVRCEEQECCLQLKDLQDRDVNWLYRRLLFLRDTYVVPKLKVLQQSYPKVYLQEAAQEWIGLIQSEDVLWNAAEIMMRNFQKYVELIAWEELYPRYETIVFENAQGLLLDWDNEEYAPHLTASYTGLKNVVPMVAQITSGEVDIEVAYVSRSYVTRHGAGRLDFECSKETINPDMVDATNVPNPWQDSLRYAKHPGEREFFMPLVKDLNYLHTLNTERKHMKARVNIYLTHLEETGGKILFCDGAKNLAELQKAAGESGDLLVCQLKHKCLE